MKYCKTVGNGYTLYTKAEDPYATKASLISVEFSKNIKDFTFPERDQMGRTITELDKTFYWTFITGDVLWPDTMIIPPSITEMGCLPGLPCKTLIVEGNIKKIKDNQFLNNRKLERIVLSQETTYIGVSAFQGCGSLENPCDIVVKDNCVNIDKYCFGSSILGYFHWPNNAHRIPDGCFGYAQIECLDLTDAVISKIGYVAFEGTLIRELRLPYYPLSDEVWQKLKNAKIDKIV